MPVPHRYDDPCGIARALDVVGDRWALLVVRELMFGPKRFVQLRAGLHGISPNVLAQRLRDLEDAGLLRREVLEPPASVAVYELTGRGRALEPVLLELGRWGSQEPVTTPRELSVSALLVALKTVFDPAAAAPFPAPADAPAPAAAPFPAPADAPAPAGASYALRVGGQWFRLTVTGRSIDIAAGRPERPTATLDTDVATLRAVAFGRERIADAERDGRLTVHGDRAAAERFTRMFPVPAG
jgi:DNA-binding HxlR family transcriptional regulator